MAYGQYDELEGYEEPQEQPCYICLNIEASPCDLCKKWVCKDHSIWSKDELSFYCVHCAKEVS